MSEELRAMTEPGHSIHTRLLVPKLGPANSNSGTLDHDRRWVPLTIDDESASQNHQAIRLPIGRVKLAVESVDEVSPRLLIPWAVQLQEYEHALIRLVEPDE